MSSPIIQLTAALITELAAGTFSLPYTATRAYSPYRTLEELTTASESGMVLSMVPASQDIRVLDRSDDERDFVVDIGIQKKVSDKTLATIDPLMAFVDEVVTFLARRRLTDFSTAKWLLTENDQIYHPAHLDDIAVFTSVLRLHYRVMA